MGWRAWGAGASVPHMPLGKMLTADVVGDHHWPGSAVCLLIPSTPIILVWLILAKLLSCSYSAVLWSPELPCVSMSQMRL